MDYKKKYLKYKRKYLNLVGGSKIWQFMGDHGWTNYSKSDNDFINANAHKKVFQLRQYTIDLINNTQTNNDYRTTRQIKFVSSTLSVNPLSQWQFQDNLGNWKNFNQNDNDYINKNKNKHLVIFNLNSQFGKYVIDLSQNTQTNITTGKARPIQNITVSTPHLAPIAMAQHMATVTPQHMGTVSTPHLAPIAMAQHMATVTPQHMAPVAKPSMGGLQSLKLTDHQWTGEAEIFRGNNYLALSLTKINGLPVDRAMEKHLVSLAQIKNPSWSEPNAWNNPKYKGIRNGKPSKVGPHISIRKPIVSETTQVKLYPQHLKINASSYSLFLVIQAEAFGFKSADGAHHLHMTIAQKSK